MSIQGHALIVCVIPGRRVSWTVWIFCLAISNMDIWGLVSKVYSTLMVILMCTSQLALELGFYFYKLHSPTAWIFAISGFSAMSYMDNFSRDPIRSWGSHWHAALRKLSLWFPGCLMHLNISPPKLIRCWS